MSVHQIMSVVFQEDLDIVDGSTSDSGSEGENLSVMARKTEVMKALLPLGISSAETSDPPVIAVLGSGGGLRAMIGFLGTLSKLAELKLLDVVTYIGGTSGSTWCMSSLYCNENWTDFSCMKELESQLCENIKSETKRDWKESAKKMKERFLGKMFSLTDFWAYGVVFKITNTINAGKLSEHKERCENGKNPYPVYSAVQKENLNDKLGAWFEFTPHLSGFPAYKSYVKSEYLGSKFEGGHLVKENPEHDLTYLQGMWGSALGDTIPHLLWRLIYDALQEFISYLHEGVVTLCNACKKVKQILAHDLEVIKEEAQSFWHTICNMLDDALKSTLGMSHCMRSTPGKMKCARVKRAEPVRDICENAIMINNIVSCIAQWKWGTTNNFLYQWKSKIHKEADISIKKQICLIDAGYEINTPYPLMLSPHRKVDLILSFDFSQGGPFETLTQTAAYCKEYNVPFPEISIEDGEKAVPSKSCYSFDGDGNEMPHVMHFPQFNTETCEDAAKLNEMRIKYDTHVISYDEAQLKELLENAKKNVEKNKDQIVEKIKQCIESSNCRAIPTE